MKRAVILLGACLVIGTAAFFMLHGSSRPYDPDAATYADKFTYWQQRVHTVGGAKAYEELADFADAYSVGVQHNETHIFGSALYRVEGVPGIAVCDERFEYACYHQMIGETFADLGMESFPKIAEVCKGSPACLHSIGHGVLAQEGYAFPDLRRAVGVCKTLPGPVYVEGCYGGLFMEYNMRRLLGDNQRPRPVGEDWLDPCSQFSGTLGRICYYWQPTWWRSQIAPDDLILTEPGYKKMGDLCETVSDQELKASCFEGTGVIALNAGRTSAEGVAKCEYVSGGAFGNALCRTGAARLIALLGRSEEARSVCTALSGAYQKGCLQLVSETHPGGLPMDTTPSSKRIFKY